METMPGQEGRSELWVSRDISSLQSWNRSFRDGWGRDGEPTGTGASGNEGLEAGDGGEVGAEQMLEPKKVKSDGRQRPLGMWGGSAAGFRTQRTLFPKGNIFFLSLGRKRKVC